MMRAVVDANVLVSAYTVNGKVCEYWNHKSDEYSFVISPEIFTEVERTLRRPAFALNGNKIRTILLDILQRCDLVRPSAAYAGYIPDENDRHLISLALEVGAKCVISGDRALQDCERIGGIEIISPGRWFASTR